MILFYKADCVVRNFGVNLRTRLKTVMCRYRYVCIIQCIILMAHITFVVAMSKEQCLSNEDINFEDDKLNE